jgi:hypothetical protein
MPQSAIVIIAIVITDTANMKSLTCSSQSVTNTIPSAQHEQRCRADPELRPQQLPHGMGSTAAARACVLQRDARKMNRAATDCEHEAGDTRFRNGMTLTEKNVTPSPFQAADT